MKAILSKNEVTGMSQSLKVHIYIYIYLLMQYYWLLLLTKNGLHREKMVSGVSFDETEAEF
jgi:hypothetical protein